MPMNIITKLKRIKISNTSEDYYLGKRYHKLNSLIEKQMKINYVKKFNGKGPKVFDSLES